MKQYNWQVGIPFILGFTCVATFPVILRSVDDFGSVFTLFIYNLLIITLSWMGCYYFKFSTKRRWLYFVCCFLYASFLVSALYFFGEVWLGYEYKALIQFRGSQRFVMQFFRGFLLSGLVSFVIYHLEILKEKQNHALELERLIQKQLEANISSLKEQLSPHFLFNSLNTLKSLIKSDTDASQDFVVNLAEVYRFLLNHKEHTTVSVYEELQFIQAYSYLLKKRFGNSFEIHIRIPDEALQYSIPPLTLQLLIENAVKHNIVSKNKPLQIEIMLEGDYFKVINNYQPKNNGEPSGNVGLANLNKRYELLIGRGIEISKRDDFFEVNVPILQ